MPREYFTKNRPRARRIFGRIRAMSYETLTLKAAAAHLHMDERELLHAAQRGEVAAEKRGDDWVFEHRLLDEWAQRRVLELTKKDLRSVHAEETRAARGADGSDLVVSELLCQGAVVLDLPSKTKGGILRDMADLADKTGYVYDPDEYYRELVSREEAASTALPGGVAFLHARFHDPYHASDSFLLFARARQPVFFGAPDDEPTDLFFLVFCTTHERHLHVLSRLAMMASHTNLLESLRAATSEDEVRAVVLAAEKETEKSV